MTGAFIRTENPPTVGTALELRLLHAAHDGRRHGFHRRSADCI